MFVPKIDELLVQIQLGKIYPSRLISKGLNFLPLFILLHILKEILQQIIVTVYNKSTKCLYLHIS